MIAGIGSGTLVTGGVCSVAVYLNAIKKNFSSEADYIAELKTQATENIGNAYDEEGKTRNFFCSFFINGVEKIEKNCDIYKLGQKQENKLRSLDDFEKTNDQPLSTDTTASHTGYLFKFKSANSELYARDWQTPIDVKLKLNGNNEDKHFGVFTLNYRFVEKTVEGPTNLFLGQVIKIENTDEVSNNSSCRLLKEKSGEEKSCNIYKSKDAFDLKNYKDQNIGSSTFNTTTTHNQIAKDDVFLIDLKKENVKKISLLNSQKNILYLYNSGSNGTKKEIATIKIITPFSYIETFNLSSSKPIILS